MNPTADRRSVAVFCTPLTGHFKRLRPVIAGLSRPGFVVNVYTLRQFASEVVRASGNFHDLFGEMPARGRRRDVATVRCRYVTHAAKFAYGIADASPFCYASGRLRFIANQVFSRDP